MKLLFVLIYISNMALFACDNCAQIPKSSGNPHEHPIIKIIRSGVGPEYLFGELPHPPPSEFCFAKLSDVHRMGEVSASVVMACKCGKPWHTWILKSRNQLQKSQFNQIKKSVYNYKSN